MKREFLKILKIKKIKKKKKLKILKNWKLEKYLEIFPSQRFSYAGKPLHQFTLLGSEGEELNWKAEVWRPVMPRETLMLFIYHQQEKHNADLLLHCLLFTENAQDLHWNPSI